MEESTEAVGGRIGTGLLGRFAPSRLAYGVGGTPARQSCQIDGVMLG
jgi:hypothetical protein